MSTATLTQPDSLLKQVKDHIARHPISSQNPHLQQDIIALQSLIATLLCACFITPAKLTKPPTAEASESLELVRMALAHMPVAFFAFQASSQPSVSAATHQAASHLDQTQDLPQPSAVSVLLVDTQLPDHNPKPMAHFDIWILYVLLWCLAIPNMPQAIVSDIQDTISDISDFVLDKNPDPTIFQRTFLSFVDLAMMIEPHLHSQSPQYAESTLSSNSLAANTRPFLSLLEYNVVTFSWIKCSDTAQSSACIEFSSTAHLTKFSAHILNTLEWMLRKGPHSVFVHLNKTCRLISRFLCWKSSFFEHSLQMTLFPLVKLILSIDCFILPVESLEWAYFLIIGMADTSELRLVSVNADEPTQKGCLEFQNILGNCLLAFDPVDVDWLVVSTQIEKLISPTLFSTIVSPALQYALSEIHRKIKSEISTLHQSSTNIDGLSTQFQTHLNTSNSASSTSFPLIESLRVGWKRRRIQNTRAPKNSGMASTNPLLTCDALGAPKATVTSFWEELEIIALSDVSSSSLALLKHLVTNLRQVSGVLFQENFEEFMCKAYSKCLELIGQSSKPSHLQIFPTLRVLIACLTIQDISPDDNWVSSKLSLLPALVAIPVTQNAASLFAGIIDTCDLNWSEFAASIESIVDTEVSSDKKICALQITCIQVLGYVGRFQIWRASVIQILKLVLKSPALAFTWQQALAALSPFELEDTDLSCLITNIRSIACGKQIQEFALETLGSLCCLCASTLSTESHQPQCNVCHTVDTRSLDILDTAFKMNSDLCMRWSQTWCELASTSSIRDNPDSIIALCDAIRNFMMHTSGDYHAFLKSSYREFLLTFLSHPSRSVRLHASRAIASYVRVPATAVCIENLTVLADQALRLIRTHSSPVFLDSFITLCGYLASCKSVVESGCLTLILTTLIECFGNQNLFIRSKAYAEICDIAKFHGFTTAQLLRENLEGWSRIAVSNLKKAPSIPKLLSQLNSVTLPQFLVATLTYTLPPLVLDEDLSLIQALSSVIKRKHQTILIESCGDVIAYLLMHHQPGDKEVLERFNTISTNQISSIHQLFFSCRLTLITNLTIELGSSDDSICLRALQSLRYVESILYPDANTCESSEPTSGFMTTFILAIILEFNETIISDGQRSLSFMIKTLRSLRELIRLCGPAISSFVPQVVGVLQSALEKNKLCTATLECWDMLLRQLNSQDLASLFCQVAVTLLRIEPQSTPSQRTLIIDIFEYALIESENGSDLVGQIIGTIPDLPEWQHVFQLVHEHSVRTDIWAQMMLPVSNLSNENAMVVQQALEKLMCLLTEHSLVISSSMLDERPNPLLHQIIQQLFKTCRIYNSSTPTISSLCCECLGALGAPDPTTVSVVLETDGHFGPKWDILSKNDAIVFACSLIERQLAPSFRSTHSTKMQGFLAFTIQEILAFCGFTPEVFQKIDFGKPQDPRLETPDEVERRDYLQKRWLKFPKSIMNTIQPLVGAKYSVAPPLLPPYVYPIFSKASDAHDWTKSFALDTFSRMQPEYLCTLFQMFGNVIQEGETNLAQLLLPHAVLNVLLSKHRLHTEDLLCEVLAVLQDDYDQAQSEKYRLCVQVVFKLIDHLTKWIRIKRIHLAKQRILVARKARTAVSVAALEELELQIAIVDDWLAQIPQVVTAQASLGCNAYARALMHYEQHVRLIRNSSDIIDMQPVYAELQRIYAQLEDPDSLQGISALVLSPTLDQQILTHENAGRWTDAQTCYELALQLDPESQDYQLGLLRCLQHLGHYETLLTHVNGILERNPKEMLALHAQGIEAAWRLGDWPLLEKFLSLPHKSGFQTSIGRLLLAMNTRQDESVADLLKQARSSVTTFIAAASMESYQRGYDSVLQLSMLNELESVYRIMQNDVCDESVQMSTISRLFKSWDMRLKITFPSYRQREPILSLRRVLLSMVESVFYNANLETVSDYVSRENGRLWLQTAKDARKAGYLQTAYGATLHAMHFKVPQVVMERAKLLWAYGQRHQAIWELERAREKSRVDGSSSSVPVGIQGMSQSQVRSATVVDGKDSSIVDTQSDNYLRAKTGLLLNRWIEETSGLMSNGIIAAYQQISKELPQWEKCAFYLGRFYNRLREGEAEKFGSSMKARSPQYALQTLQISLICFKQYIKAISYGTKYMYQTMPRLLTLWLDCGNLVLELPADDERVKKFEMLNQHMRKLCITLPTYQFLSAMPQLVSRISHKNQQVQQVIEATIVDVMRVFPQQTLWHLMSVGKSTVKSRVRRVTSIFSKLKNEANARNPGRCNTESLVMEAQKLTDQLLHLCNFTIPRDVSSISMAKDFRTLQRMTPLSMIIPLQSSMTVTLPTSSKSAASHMPFPNDLPTIQGFHDDIEVMSSLQRPRKINIRGSDGKDYIFLCKPVDDLRKDSRLMEFNAMINRLLKKDPDARKRDLYIRTYAVVPLNEECGIIEWVNNVSGYRNILISSYKARNLYVHHNEIKQLMERKTPSQEEIFRTIIIPKHPPIFHEWFLETFPEPSQWLSSRLTYATTTAVMSMVGHIVGLGDRHGENILFDELTGACLHVDLNCLFGKGLEFEKPERVPFRLTHNMVDAFGLSGTEGVFRKSCELTLKVLQDNRESLTTVLETFLHDPLCEWSKTRGRGAPREEPGEQENEKARYILQGISRKLRGFVSNVNAGLSLSVEGQVHELISEATSTKNLSQMYIGWAPFL
ncbi:hypothetical protein BASA81_014163 [Batrachochytrium salamandrivorans]|nr:hypothetical protein BASA81_014163 [Batrachochytrium salamandrivorans]